MESIEQNIRQYESSIEALQKRCIRLIWEYQRTRDVSEKDRIAKRRAEISWEIAQMSRAIHEMKEYIQTLSANIDSNI